MNWVNSSLQLAENLLESVDKKAAGSLIEETAAEQQRQHSPSNLSNEKTEENNDLPMSNEPKAASFTVQQTATNAGGTAGETTDATNATNSVVKQLQKQVKKLSSQLQATCNHLRLAEKRIANYEEENQHVEKEFMDRIQLLQEQVDRLTEEKQNDEVSFMQALEAKDTHAESLQQKIEQLTNTLKDKSADLEKSQKELNETRSSKEQLWSEAANSNDDSQEMIRNLRDELQTAEKNLTQTKKDFTEKKKKMLERQNELETTNSQVLQDLARQEKRNLINQQNHLSNEQQKKDREQALQKKLLSIRTRVTELERESEELTKQNKTVADEFSKTQQLLKTAKESFTAETNKLHTQISKLQSRNHSTSNIVNKIAENNTQRTKPGENDKAIEKKFESRLQAMADRLVKKQDALDRVNSKVASLEIRLQQQAKNYRNEKIIDSGSSTYDMENGAMRPRHRNLNNSISRIGPIRRSKRVATAVSKLDQWMMICGRFLGSNPTARLIFLVYVFLLHLWVFVILGFHTNHLQEEIKPNPAVKPAAGIDAGIKIPGN